MDWLLVMLGGGLGAGLRLGTIKLVKPYLPADQIFWSILIINALGGFFIAVLDYALKAGYFPAPEAWRWLLITGLLGGFTTFSAYTLDGYGLLVQGRHLMALVYIMGSVVASFAAFALGLRMMQQIG